MIRQRTDQPTLEGPRAASARRGTLWLFREQLTRAGAIETRFARFDRRLRDAGYLAPRRSADRRCFADGASALLRPGGQIVDATVVEARRPRLKARRRPW